MMTPDQLRKDLASATRRPIASGASGYADHTAAEGRIMTPERLREMLRRNHAPIMEFTLFVSTQYDIAAFDSMCKAHPELFISGVINRCITDDEELMAYYARWQLERDE